MGIEVLSISFGAAGSPQAVTLAEQLYAALPVGFGGVTQERWRSNTITVNGIAFTLFPGIDSDGRADCWIYAAFGEATAQQTGSDINREFAAVDLQVSLNGTPQTLWGGTTTYSYNHQRSTWLRWQSGVLAWQTSPEFIKARIEDGTFLRHDSRNGIGALENSNSTNLPDSTVYQPFKSFATWDQVSSVGDSPRRSVGGGERTSIGPAHEWMARLISEVGTNDNPSWLTASRLAVLQNLAESAGQFPHASGFLDPADYRLLDPSVKPHCSHGNPTAWYTATGIPQPGTQGNAQDGEYDHAHPYNKFSFQAYHLTRDPFHLLQVQGQAVCSLTYQSLYGDIRGTDGKTLVVGGDQERGNWWALQTLIQAWHATPSGTMPKPFRDKAFFATAINNTLDWIRNKCISSTTHQTSGVVGEAMRFWRVTAELGAGIDATYAAATHFQEDYGHLVMAQSLLLGYSGARDVAEWHVVNMQRRLELGGNWYLNDPHLADTTGKLYYVLGPRTGTLPYSDVASYKSWYPTKQKYVDGSVSSAAWTLNYGRDTYLFLGAVNLYKEVARRGLVTLPFDAAGSEASLKARFTPPYTDAGTGNPLNYTMHAKQYFSYPTAAASEAEPTTFFGGAFASVPMGATFIHTGESVVPTVTSVTVSPSIATGSTTFSAVVNGTDNPSQAVTWTLTPNLGTIDAAGVFVEPAKTNQEQVILVRARSVQDSNYSGTATVTIAALPRPPAPVFTVLRRGRGRNRSRR